MEQMGMRKKQTFNAAQVKKRPPNPKDLAAKVEGRFLRSSRNQPSHESFHPGGTGAECSHCSQYDPSYRRRR